jgi:hypothetical protein
MDKNQSIEPKFFTIDDEKELLNLKARAEKAEAELRKWEKLPDDENLREVKEQANQNSLAAKQAYIGGLEHNLAHVKKENAELRERMKGIETTSQALSEFMLASPQNIIDIPDEIYVPWHEAIQKAAAK